MRPRSIFDTTVVIFLFFALSTTVVASFSTAAKNLWNQNDRLASTNKSFGSVQQSFPSSAKFPGIFFASISGRDESTVIQKMVVEGGSVDSIDCDDDIKENSANEDDNHQKRQVSVWNRLLDWFQGDFDNYSQVVEDRKQNLKPREGGGHEHFHCTLVPLTESTRLAAFFFDGNPNRIFRFRHYEMIPSATNNEAVEMMLNTLHPDLEKLLKSQASDPLSWPEMFQNFQPKSEKEPKVNRLMKCEISWSFDIDPIQHSYLTDIPEDDPNNVSKPVHAVMVHGPTVVNSNVVPGMQIRIIDQLSLYQNIFYINDRGFDPISGAFIYGNQREVPYRLERVSSLSSSSEDGRLKRTIINSDLEWTMGPDFRSSEEYELKLESIGGLSVGMNKNSFKNSNTRKS